MSSCPSPQYSVHRIGNSPATSFRRKEKPLRAPAAGAPGDGARLQDILPRWNGPSVPGNQKTCVAYIICEPCIGTKDSACVDVCPVDCIHPRKDEPDFTAAEMLYIHPDECIDCGACVPACPVEAIFALDETPQKWESFIPVNAQYYRK